MTTSVPPKVDGIWLWVYYNKIPIYHIFYLLKGDYISTLFMEVVFYCCLLHTVWFQNSVIAADLDEDDIEVSSL